MIEKVLGLAWVLIPPVVIFAAGAEEARERGESGVLEVGKGLAFLFSSPLPSGCGSSSSRQ